MIINIFFHFLIIPALPGKASESIPRLTDQAGAVVTVRFEASASMPRLKAEAG